MKFFVTTPIYYVNDQPHIGHAYTTIAADVLARYNRMRGRLVFFLTGTDEHGQKVEQAAAAHGREPKEHADLMVENFKTLWKTLGLSHDAFIRTTDAQHTHVVRDLLMKLWEKKEIVRRTYSGWYCTPCERFWTEKDLKERACPDCGRPVEHIEEDNYFFLMVPIPGQAHPAYRGASTVYPTGDAEKRSDGVSQKPAPGGPVHLAATAPALVGSTPPL
jgi:methionyl-tRNA synthetase